MAHNKYCKLCFEISVPQYSGILFGSSLHANNKRAILKMMEILFAMMQNCSCVFKKQNH
jgi:hypothetical protein